MTISTDRPFAEVVHGATARSHDLSWPPTQPDGTEIVYCIYCGAYARDVRPHGLPWIDMTPKNSSSLVLACSGPTAYDIDGSPKLGAFGTRA